MNDIEKKVYEKQLKKIFGYDDERKKSVKRRIKYISNITEIHIKAI